MPVPTPQPNFIWPPATDPQSHRVALRSMLADPSNWKPERLAAGELFLLIGTGDRPCHLRVHPHEKTAGLTWFEADPMGARGFFVFHRSQDDCQAACPATCADDFSLAIERWSSFD